MIRVMVWRDVRRAFAGAAWLPVVFFLLVATLVPFSIGPDAKLLARISAGVLWIAALTASLLPIERLIEPDSADGVIDQLLLRGISTEIIVAARMLSHWLTFGPLILLAAVPGAVLLGGGLEALVPLAIGTPGLAALAVAVACLTAGVRAAGALSGLLLMPVAVPLLIFGAAASGGEGEGALKLEAAVSLLLVAGTPFVGGAALRAGRS